MTTLEKLSIEHYKGFFEPQEINFAIPNGGNGSGLTLIVGPNNTGKTTVLESLLLNNNRKFKASERHGISTPKITIQAKDNEARICTCTYTNIDNGSQIKVDGTHGINFEVIQARRHWNHYSNSAAWTPETLVNQSIQHDTRSPSGLEIAAILKHINRDRQLKDNFNSYMKEFIPHFTGWTIDTNDQGDYIKYQASDCEHQTNLLGDGVISLFRICAHLIDTSKNTVLIIDEPELSLHPAAQKSLSHTLSKASCDKQIIVCTHSPYFANWEDFTSGAKFVRLNKVNDKQCEVSCLKKRKKYSDFIDKNTYDWQKPQILDIVAKEILFAEKILFVEGQEDVGLIKKWLKDNNKNQNFDIFGYGVGGYSNMKIFLEIAKDLGLHKVAALYDSGQDADKHFEEDKKKHLVYCIEKLPTEDIRDKPEMKKLKQCLGCEHNSMSKKGVFDIHGKIKPIYEKSMASIMEIFINYFDK